MSSKIALVISGHVRDYQTYLPLLLDLKTKLNADVFISTYLNKGIGIRFWQGQKENDDNLDESNIRNIVDILTPISYTFSSEVPHIEKMHNLQFQNKKIDTQNVYKMLYKMWDSNNLKVEYENSMNFKYDLVVRTRFDLIYKRIDLTNISKNQVFSARADIPMYMTDTFFISDSHTMDMICDIKNNYGVSVNPADYHNCEHMLTEWILQHNTEIVVGNLEVHLRDKVFK